ncbi:glycoside hydrolase family 19 protein [Brucella gallinifaecis]|uniref:glycoside hydrolase family 19 protein n=1 Tax=Brucella gallinifaecis TaxID=215590 RepID=UPI002361492A|nr:glycoside hydrolase family 19 protein [Brucella gallinifaecis]
MNMNLGDTRLLIEAGRERGLLRNQMAYVLATAYHETAHTMKPINEMGGEKYLRSKKYWPYIGRGYVQITWKVNYEKAGKVLGVDFVSKPELLLKAEYAAPIIIAGMVEGWFTGKKLSDYITLQKSDFKSARRIVNGTDKADLIAGYAREYDKALLNEGYGVDTIIEAKPNDVLPEPAVEKPISKSSRFWSWIGSGGAGAAIPFVDWRVQMVLVVFVLALTAYAIFTMPQAKAKLEKLVDAI